MVMKLFVIFLLFASIKLAKSSQIGSEPVLQEYSTKNINGCCIRYDLSEMCPRTLNQNNICDEHEFGMYIGATKKYYLPFPPIKPITMELNCDELEKMVNVYGLVTPRWPNCHTMKQIRYSGESLRMSIINQFKKLVESSDTVESEPILIGWATVTYPDFQQYYTLENVGDMVYDIGGMIGLIGIFTTFYLGLYLVLNILK